MNQLSIKFITGKNAQGLYLENADIQTLLFLNEQKLISQMQLYEFYKLFKHVHYDSFRKRMRKFEEKGIIQKRKYVLMRKNGFRLDLLRITPKGASILIEAGLLSKASGSYEPKKNYDHVLGTKEVVIQAIRHEAEQTGFMLGGGGEHLFLFNNKAPNDQLKTSQFLNIPSGNIRIYENEDLGVNQQIQRGEQRFRLINTLYSFDPYRYRYLDENRNHFIIPDWVFGFSDGINNYRINIEVDTGSEKFKKGESDERLNIVSIEAKIENYIKLAKLYPRNKHFILIAHLDNSITVKGDYGRKISRIKNFKQRIIGVQGFLDSPLEIYVFPIARSKKVVGHILESIKGKYSEESLLQQAIRALINNPYLIKQYKIDVIESHEGLKAKNILATKLDYTVPGIITFTERYPQNPHDIFEQSFIPVILFEGDVRSQDKLVYLSEQVEKHQYSWPKNTKILAIYPDKDSMMGDILRSDVLEKHVYLSNLEDLSTYTKTDDVNTTRILYNVKRKDDLPFEAVKLIKE
jgi:hypothetical protein